MKTCLLFSQCERTGKQAKELFFCVCLKKKRWIVGARVTQKKEKVHEKCEA